MHSPGIGESAFHDFSSLRSLSLPASLTSIDEFAFDSCTALSAVSFGGFEAQRNMRIGAAGSAAESFADAKGYTFVEGIASEVEFVFFGD